MKIHLHYINVVLKQIHLMQMGRKGSMKNTSLLAILVLFTVTTASAGEIPHPSLKISEQAPSLDSELFLRSLSEKKRNKIREIAAYAFRKEIALAAKINKAEMEIQAVLMKESPPSEYELAKLVNELIRLEGWQRRLQMNRFFRLRRALTLEQWKKL